MTYDTPYIVGHIADLPVILQRSGRWDLALQQADLLPPAEAALRRAQVLVDRFWWRLDDPDEPEAAVADLAARDRVVADYYGAQLAYTRMLFGHAPRPDDTERAARGFAAAADDPRISGWGTFWVGVYADNVDGSPERARPAYASALTCATENGDTFLESYAVRHLGDHDGDTDLLRRSYYLRAALGARPHTATAALTLADALNDGPDARQLREIAAHSARDLHLTWLLD